jgi:hypothetical protein
LLGKALLFDRAFLYIWKKKKMITSIRLITLEINTHTLENKILNGKNEIVLNQFLRLGENRFDLEIVFDIPFKKVRNHDFNWITPFVGFKACEFAPKILQLENDFFVQANCNIGIWEIKDLKTLLWRFNPEYSTPLTNFKGKSNEKSIISATGLDLLDKTIALLFSKENSIEFSRSKIPFSAVACFTDHCDFDTINNLKTQRELFKMSNIKFTKGFFLNNYSKRENASYEENKEELDFWKNDGHELAYHSLSQSIKSVEKSIEDFKLFSPPFNNTPVWIDHGYQPYNFSLYKENNIDEIEYCNTLTQKNISILWNYIDSGNGTEGVINQMNTSDFTLKSYYNGIKKLPFNQRISLLIKNIMFHYYADEKKIILYKNLASTFKRIIKKKSFKGVFVFFKDSFSVLKPLISVLLNWNYHKKIPYKYAKYSPIVFKHKIGQKYFYVFQTLEIIDFKTTLSKKNIQKLIDEKGVFIGHTYFSAPMKYHTGRVFREEDKIDDLVKENFLNLGISIKENKIWNPLLSEFVNYVSGFEKVVLDVDNNGRIVVIETGNLIFRQIE